MDPVGIAARTLVARGVWRSLLLTATLAVAACGRPNPPLLPPGRAAALATLKSPYAALYDGEREADVSAHSADLMVLRHGQALRDRVRREVDFLVGLYWPRGLTQPSAPFAAFDAPKLACPQTSPDGEVCTLVFAPRRVVQAMSPSARITVSPQELQALSAGGWVADSSRGGEVAVRMDVDEGGREAFLRPPAETRPPMAPGAPSSRIVAGDVLLDRLGRQAMVCRAETSPGRAWERRSCAIEYGAVRMTVSRDVDLASAPASLAAFAGFGDDPALMSDVKDAARLLVATVHDPLLMRALPPLRAGNNPDSVLIGTATQGAIPDNTASLRAYAAAGAGLPWHDVVDQSEFDTLCLEAAKKRSPLLIYTADGAGLVQDFIYDEQFKRFAPHAMLVLVRMYPAAGESPWALGFADAIGAGKWSALTVTDRPRWSHDACEVGKVHQGPATEVHPADVIRALLTGRPPPIPAASDRRPS